MKRSTRSSVLAKCSRDELVSLIERLLERAPELEQWIEAALPLAVKRKGDLVAAKTYCEQAKAVLLDAGYGWDADRSVTDQLSDLQDIGDAYFEGGDYQSASAVYSGVLEGFIAEYETFHDETRNCFVPVQECIIGLGGCLEQFAKNPKERQSALEALFSVLKYDIEFGGLSLADDVPDILLEKASELERTRIIEWIHRATDGVSSDWTKQAYGSLLLVLEGDILDDEAFLEHCRTFGNRTALVDRLLTLKRFDESLAEIQKAEDWELTQHADILITHKKEDIAEKLMRERLQTSKKPRWQLLDWLERFYVSRENWSSALGLTMDTFRTQPSRSGFQKIRDYAIKNKQWPALKDNVMEIVRRQGDADVLTLIHLDENEIADAIAVWRSNDDESKRMLAETSVRLELAQAAVETFPEIAIELYSEQAESLIAYRGRKNYQSACGYLEKIKRLYSRLKRERDWQEYIDNLRSENRALRALKDELERANLQ